MTADEILTVLDAALPRALAAHAEQRDHDEARLSRRIAHAVALVRDEDAETIRELRAALRETLNALTGLVFVHPNELARLRKLAGLP